MKNRIWLIFHLLGLIFLLPQYLYCDNKIDSCNYPKMYISNFDPAEEITGKPRAIVFASKRFSDSLDMMEPHPPQYLAVISMKNCQDINKIWNQFQQIFSKNTKNIDSRVNISYEASDNIYFEYNLDSKQVMPILNILSSYLNKQQLAITIHSLRGFPLVRDIWYFTSKFYPVIRVFFPKTKMDKIVLDGFSHIEISYDWYNDTIRRKYVDIGRSPEVWSNNIIISNRQVFDSIQSQLSIFSKEWSGSNKQQLDAFGGHKETYNYCVEYSNRYAFFNVLRKYIKEKEIQEFLEFLHKKDSRIKIWELKRW